MTQPQDTDTNLSEESLRGFAAYGRSRLAEAVAAQHQSEALRVRLRAELAEADMLHAHNCVQVEELTRIVERFELMADCVRERGEGSGGETEEDDVPTIGELILGILRAGETLKSAEIVERVHAVRPDVNGASVRKALGNLAGGNGPLERPQRSHYRIRPEGAV